MLRSKVQLSDNLTVASPLRSIDWADDTVVLVDQTLLPGEEDWVEIAEVDQLVSAIKRLAVRGAPSLGVAGALGVVLAAKEHQPNTEEFAAAVDKLRRARPTAVNLARAVDRVAARATEGVEAILDEALQVRDEEIEACHSMAITGARFLVNLCGDRPLTVMTVCNTGALAAVETGTALGVIAQLHTNGHLAEALTLETRPLLQGARLNTWELGRLGVPHRLVVDSAGPFLMAQGGVDAVVTGADRIAANGDTANKIGSFSLALGARYAGVPFVVVAPESSIDMETASGDDVVIEDRGPDEVIAIRGMKVAPEGTPTANPAFDITPFQLITAIVTERRVVRIDQGEALSPGPRPGDETKPDTK